MRWDFLSGPMGLNGKHAPRTARLFGRGFHEGLQAMSKQSIVIPSLTTVSSLSLNDSFPIGVPSQPLRRLVYQ